MKQLPFGVTRMASPNGSKLQIEAEGYKVDSDREVYLDPAGEVYLQKGPSQSSAPAAAVHNIICPMVAD
eukprot:SAG22_NODE_18_length_32591_cov_38.043549_17_plen_69_part_00